MRSSTSSRGHLRTLVAEASSGRGRLLLALGAGAGAAGSAVALAATSAWLISAASLRPPVLTLMVAIVSVRFFGIARGVLRYVERLLGHDAAFRILGDLRVRVYQRLERLAPAGIADLRSGDVMSRFVSDVDGLADVWLRLLLPTGIAVVVAVGTAALLASLAPGIAVVVAAGVGVLLVAAPLVSRTVSARSQVLLQDRRGAVATELVDVINAAPELLLYGRMDERLNRLEAHDHALARAEAVVARGAGLAGAVTALGAGLMVTASAWLGVVAVAEGSLSGVTLAVVILTPLALAEVIGGLAPAADLLPRLRRSAARVHEVIDRPAPMSGDAAEEAAAAAPDLLPGGSVGVRLRGVRAQWPTGSASPVVLGDLTLAPGERVAMVGVSGSGKSTLAAVMVGFLEPDAGTYQLDVTAPDGSTRVLDADGLPGDALRERVSLVEQDTYLFDSTIEANLRLARPDADEADLREALHRVRLLDWVDGLPDGMQTYVGEHGTALSGGQRQRLGVARAVLADRPVVVLDEPTEHLDAGTAIELLDDVMAALSGRTVLVITHRPPGAAVVDRIVELRDGRIVPVSF